jgi:hypothetical protein
MNPREALSGVDKDTQDRFLAYHNQHPEVWQAFERFALEAAEVRGRYGAKGIMERVRWHTEITRGEDFKANNNFTAYYARIFVAKHPRFSGLFEFREINGLRSDYEKAKNNCVL